MLNPNLNAGYSSLCYVYKACYIPANRELEVYVYRNHLVRPSVCLFVCLCNPSGPVFLTEEHWRFFLYIKILYDLNVCHDFDQRSFRLIQDHWKEMDENCVRSISLICKSIGRSAFTLRLLQGVSLTRPMVKCAMTMVI